MLPQCSATLDQIRNFRRVAAPTPTPSVATQINAARHELQEHNDCTVQAVAKITGVPYAECHKRFEANGREHGKGITVEIAFYVLQELGYETTRAVGNYAGTRISELVLPPDNSFVVTTRDHMLYYRNTVQDWTAFRNHVVEDVYGVVKVRNAIEFEEPVSRMALEQCILSDETKEFLKPAPISRRDWIEIDVEKDKSRFDVRLFELSPTGVENYPSGRANKWAKDVPGAKARTAPMTAIKGNWWLMPTGMYTVLRVLTTYGPERVRFASQEAELKFQLVRARFVQNEKIRRINYDWQTDKIVPNHGLTLHPERPLASYQQVAAYLATCSESFALLMEQGTGKTATIIAAISNIVQKSTPADGPQFHLVICPRNVVHNWAREVDAFATEKFEVGILRGVEYKRIEHLATAIGRVGKNGIKGAICITNYETAVAMKPIIAAVPWATMTLDESHNIASPNTKRTQTFLTTFRDCAKQRFLLTGTPIPNTAMDLWAQFEFLAEAASGFGDYKTFNKFFGKFQRDDESGFEQLVGIQHAPLLKEAMAGWSFVIRKKDALPDLPEKLKTTRDVDMSPAQRHVYTELATKLAVEIEDEMSSSHLSRGMLIQNVLTKLLRLAQVAAGHVVWDAVEDESGAILQPKTIEHFTDTPRIDTLREIVTTEREKNEKVIIWACWIPALDMIEKMLQDADVKYIRYQGNDDQRTKLEYQFNNDDRTVVFLANPASAGVGLNLLGYNPKADVVSEMNATKTVFYASNWSAVKESQSSDRNHRRGTREPVTEIHLLVPSSIDEEMYKRRIGKHEVAADLSDIKAILTSILEGLKDVD